MILQYYSYVPDAGILVMMQQQYFEFATMIFLKKSYFLKKSFFERWIEQKRKDRHNDHDDDEPLFFFLSILRLRLELRRSAALIAITSTVRYCALVQVACTV